ncbi:MAG: FGGY family carbohydrate kinase [Oscillospiraceae bacterium]|nr:FGGY family carbohydrate kinase [Oscillospiraceae bacterium]
MEKQYLLGIDVGTTGTKALLFDADGALLGRAYRAYALSTPQVGYSEQNAEDWWNAVTETVREVCGSRELGSHVAAISLSLQGGTLVPVDADGRPLRPAIVWNDARCKEEREEFLREFGSASGMYEKTGWHLADNLPALEIRWLRKHEPEIFEKTALFLSVPDYISLKLTGIAAVDLSDVGINQLGDIRRGAYDEELLRFAGIGEEKLPKIVRSGDVIGRLTAEAARTMGLSTDCVLVAGAHDQYAVALGAGAIRDGDILIGTGTCWVVTAIGGAPAFETGLSQSVAAVPGKWGSMLSLSSGGVCLEWLRRNLAIGPDGAQLSYEALNREVAGRKAAEDGLFFYPFSGEAAQSKSFSKASFIGLDLSHDRFDIARAIMEGVAFQIVWMMESFRTKPSKEGLKLAGGASKSALWCQMVADIANLPVRIPEVADLACVGAAILAGTGCGIYASAGEGVRRLAVRERVLQPDPERAAKYGALLADYKQHAGELGTVYGL